MRKDGNILESKFITFLKQRKSPVILLALIWFCLQCFFIWNFGIVTNLEATKYINEAQTFLATGKYSTNNFLFYSTEILLIALAIKLKTGFLVIVLLQMLLNGISIICFFKIAQRLSENKGIAYLSTFYFLIFFYYHLFNTYLFTESLFFSISVIYTYFLFSQERITMKSVALLLFFLTLLYLTRPTGIYFLPATYLFIIIKFYRKHAFKIIAVTTLFALAALFLLLNFSLARGGEFDFSLPFEKEMIICGISNISSTHQIIIPVEKNSIQGLFYIVTNHPGLFISLSLKRLSAFFGVSRSFYSAFHNLFVSIYFYIMYVIILLGIRSLFKRNKAEVWFLITNIALMAITVSLSCDEWGNRFIFSVMPFFLLLSVISIYNFQFFVKHRKRQRDKN